MPVTAPETRLPLVSIVGRPNVGKSTLFNRLTRTRRAIVDSIPGVTRDRLEQPVEWRGRWFRLVDTGGLELDEQEVLPQEVVRQARAAVGDSDLVVLLVDVRAGLTPVDHEVAEILRATELPVIVAANKADHGRLDADAAEFYQLGLGEVTSLSADQGRGVDDLLDGILEGLPTAPEEAEPDDGAVRIAVVGRPNVGKSSLVNRLLGEERVIVSDVPGTTRDAVDVRLEVDGRPFVLVDTAGIRRRRTDKGRVEHVARVHAERALERADVALLLLDATEGVTHQDSVIAGRVAEAGTGLVVLVNKWDLVENREEQYPATLEDVRDHLKFASWAPVLTLSVLTGQRLSRIFPEVEAVDRRRRHRVPTAELNAALEEAVRRNQPPQGRGGREFRVKYLTQVGTCPPTFLAFTSGGAPHFTWQRFLENRLRETFDLEGTPVVIRYRGGRKDKV